ncbi:DinB family protein [Aegicerativicinus sediminis]|uniref:DinB family protein n=1 Tax=Aegicerativicinus sediminis TaxID=2893202 RepID=UPI001E2BE9C0|nr:DinB family protein [Aegicerativicinus sediminis]
MEKEEIALLIKKKNDILIEYLTNQDDELWEAGPKGKWSTGGHAKHLLQAIKPVNFALSLPRIVLKSRFGTTNRPLRNYDEIISRYLQKLEDQPNATFGPSKNMKTPPLKDKFYFIDRLQMEHMKLVYKTRHLSDKNLDELVLPHPLMGKMPIREMLQWTAYHIEHHTNILKKSYTP